VRGAEILGGDRRRELVRRHHLGGDAGSPETVTRALVALHATDPASVYLSVLARSAMATLADVSSAMYERRSLVRWMAMRRTLFVFPREDVPMVQAAVGTPLAAALRRQLISRLERNGSEPPIDGDLGAWVAGLEQRVEQALTRRGTASGAQLRSDEPALATLIPPRAPSDRAQYVTTALLTLLSADGRLVRGAAAGPWTSRHHRWEPVSRWWPGGLPAVDPARARRELARRWLARYGPATVDDLQWWTGWTKTTTRTALSAIPVEEVDLHGETGITLAGSGSGSGSGDPGAGGGGHAVDEPVAALLPALDPTPMGWKHRDWFLGVDPAQVFDRAGNIGPTLWWNGEITGSWAITAGGEVRTAMVADRGAEADDAVRQAAAALHQRLDGTVVTPPSARRSNDHSQPPDRRLPGTAAGRASAV